MSTFTRVRSLPLPVWRVAALGLLLLLSFLPSGIKVALHTRGSMHYWAHLYVFAGLSILHLEGLRRYWSRFAVLSGTLLLAVSIEVTQAHLHWRWVEVPDLVTDLFGLVLGAFAALLRASSNEARFCTVSR